MGKRPPIGSHPALARILLATVFMLAGHTLACASDVTLMWDATTDRDVAGYKVYYGTASRSYGQTIDVGRVTTFTVTGLGVGFYFFAVTAYNTSGLESGFSNEVFTVIPSQTFYYPHLSFSSSIKGIDNPVLTGVALINPGSASAAVEVTALDANGNMVAGPGITNPIMHVLQPGEQMVAIDWQWFGTNPAADPIAYARVDGTDQVLGFFEIFNSPLTILNGAEFAFPPSAPGVTQTTVVFPAIQPGGTWLQLVNASRVSVSVILQLFDAAGSQIGWASLPIDGQSTLAADVFLDLFPDASMLESEYIRVTAPPGVLAYEYLRGPSKSLQVLGAQDAMNGSTTLYSPQYAVGGSWRTTFSVVNLDSVGGFVAFTLFPDDSGVPILRTYSILANGKIEITGQSVFVASGSVGGYLTIRSSGLHLAGNVVYGDSAGAAFATGLPLVSSLNDTVFFGQLASDATYYTGIAVVNAQDSPTSIVIEIYRSDGSLATPAAEIPPIPARQRIVMLAEELFPGLGNQSGGYIRITGSQPFASFVLYGTRNLTALSAVPAQKIIR